jgi:hypothetical protein
MLIYFLDFCFVCVFSFSDKVLMAVRNGDSTLAVSGCLKEDKLVKRRINLKPMSTIFLKKMVCLRC